MGALGFGNRTVSVHLMRGGLGRSPSPPRG